MEWERADESGLDYPAASIWFGIDVESCQRKLIGFQRGFRVPRTYKPKTDKKYASYKPHTLPTKFKAGFLAQMDARTDLAKALRQNYDVIVADVGGRDDVGHIKGAMIERFVWLETILQTLEHEMAHGSIDKAEALGRWIQAVNALSGLAKVLGVERKSRSMPWLTPITQPDDASTKLTKPLPNGFKELPVSTKDKPSR